MGKSLISWTDYTFNPWRGCTKVSPGCINCYAETLSRRNPEVLGEWGPKGKRALAAESYWGLPFRWDIDAQREGVRRKVFCLSLGDIFEDREELAAPRARLGRIITDTPWLDWLLLTKRTGAAADRAIAELFPGERRNVWLGVSVEDQKTADERIPWLVEQGWARFLWVSYEPAIGPVSFERWLHDSSCPFSDPAPLRASSCLCFEPREARIDWIIVGGESGGGARPFSLRWADRTIKECGAAGVACFVKQLGARPFTSSCSDPECTHPDCSTSWLEYEDRKVGDPREWPARLRVQEFPA